VKFFLAAVSIAGWKQKSHLATKKPRYPLAFTSYAVYGVRYSDFQAESDNTKTGRKCHAECVLIEGPQPGYHRV